MCIATPPLARLRCHLLPTVSSHGPQIASRVKRERERDVTWPAITSPDAAARSDCRWQSADLQRASLAISDLQLVPRADLHAQPGTGALWLLGWRLVAIMRIVAFIFYMLKTMVLLFKAKTI